MEREPLLPRRLATHTWNISLKRAAALQNRLAAYVRLTPLVGTPNLVAGIDSAYDGDETYVAVLVMDLTAGQVIEIKCAHSGGATLFPYAPGYRAFREGATILKATKRLHHQPELYFVAGHGICHPRLCGNATHIGLLLNRPTIGCARERLVGQYEAPGPNKGDYSVIRYSPQAPGVVLRARPDANPIFISPGHRIDLTGTIEQTLRCLTKYRIPEPLRRAHIEAGRFMRLKRDRVI
ncbi:MAG TPA: endonuclease V [Acidobacteriota bacterium]|nr:endonuclease V [Acidobacteriota bacterium]